MTFLNAKAHIALGQTSLLLTLLLGALLLGLVPDRQQAVREGRAALAEAMAVSGSVLVTQSELRRLEATLAIVVERNDDLLSAAVRQANGRALIEIGEHESEWTNDLDAYSTASQLKVPIWSRGQNWGRVEMRFRPTSSPGVLGWLLDPRVRLVGFLGICTFFLFYLYLGKMLEHLDPSQAVPPHVRSALDTLAEGLVVMDTKERIVLANQAIAGIVGDSSEDLMGRRVETLQWVNADGSPFAPADFPWRAALSDGEARKNDIVLLRDADAFIRTFIVNSSPVLGSNGKPGGVLISLDDVTQLEEHKAELSVARDAAEAANKAKSDFLANMSHEIRTPMNAILGFTEVLKRGYVTDERDRRKYLETIRSSGEHLLQLINDVLDLSKVESGHFELERIRFAPHQVIQEVATVLSVKAEEKNISLEVDVDGNIPATLLTDPTRLRQIVTNLVSNAIKFTETGGVRIAMSLSREKTGARFSVRVTDSGIGLPEQSFESIFDEFVQADSSVTRRFGGTGLGLPISRRFARMMGGDISVSSVPGSGSTFTATIDPGPLDGVPMLTPEEALEATEESKPSSAGTWKFPSARILVVDDGEENRELLKVVLEDVGLEIECAENGQVCLEKARGGHFDLILMDMQMPVMDGYSASRALRSDHFAKPIIALSGNAMKGAEQECLDAGCSDYVSKPVDIDTLIALLADLLGAERTSEMSASRQPELAKVSRDDLFAGPVTSRLASNSKFLPTIEKFVRRFEANLDAMDSCFENRDDEGLASLAHWLKGSSGMVGFDAFGEPARNLEELAKGRKWSEIEGCLAELRDLADRITLPSRDDERFTAEHV